MLFACCGINISEKLEFLDLNPALVTAIKFAYAKLCYDVLPTGTVYPLGPVGSVSFCSPDFTGHVGYGDGPAAPYVAIASNKPNQYVSTATMSGEASGVSPIVNGIVTFDVAKPCTDPQYCRLVIRTLHVQLQDFEADDTNIYNAAMQLAHEIETSIASNGSFSIPTGTVTLYLTFGAKGTHASTSLRNSGPLEGTIDIATATVQLLGTFRIQPGSNSGLSPDQLSLHLRFEGPITEQPPVADASRTATTVECNTAGGSNTPLDATASSDPDGLGDLGQFHWALEAGGPVVSSLAEGPLVDAFLPLGTSKIRLFLYDKQSDVDDDTVAIQVQDTSPPSILKADVTPACLWPPNHKLVYYELGKNLAVHASDVCDTSPKIRIKSVRSSEPATAKGSGNTSPDVFVGEGAFCVRAERSGRGSGRTYEVEVEAVDSSGNSETRVVTIIVPHDQSGKRGCSGLPEAAFVEDGSPKCVFAGQ